MRGTKGGFQAKVGERLGQIWETVVAMRAGRRSHPQDSALPRRNPATNGAFFQRSRVKMRASFEIFENWKITGLFPYHAQLRRA